MLGGLLALAAPAIVRTPGLLMPVRSARGIEAWKYSRANFLTAEYAWFDLTAPWPTPENIAMVRRAIADWRGSYHEVTDAA